MAIDCTYPTTLDAIPTDRASGDAVPSTDWNKYLDAVVYLERTVGVTDSTVTSSHEYKIKAGEVGFSHTFLLMGV